MIPSLNGLRAIAISLVLLSHIYIVESVPGWLKKIIWPLANGETGVRLFFVISGFLITWLLIKEKEKNGQINLRLFYIRRFLRIFPVFYFYVLFVFISSKLAGFTIQGGVYVSALSYTQNFALWGSNWLLAHSWSLSVEEQFYLLWPGLFRGLKIHWSWKPLVLLLVIGAVARVIAYKYPSISPYLLLPFLQHADFLFGGCMLAYFLFYHQAHAVRILKKIQGWHLVVGAIIILVIGKFELDVKLDRLFLPITGTIMVVYFMTVIAWTTRSDNNKAIGFRFLNHPWLNRIGILSYSLYVWQEFFLVPVYNPVSRYWWTRFPQNILLIAVAAVLSYNFIEKPFLKIKNRFR
jgi:peptidoglycan/LPS O-acetylase OafA/YrhL